MDAYIFQITWLCKKRSIKDLLFLLAISAFINTAATTLRTPEVEIPGDVIIVGLFSIEYPELDGAECGGEIDPVSVMEVEAVKWAIERLNRRNYIQGLTIGFRAYKTCASPAIAELVVADTFHQTDIVGIIGPTLSEEASVVSRFLSSLPSNMTLPQIGYSTTGAFLSNKNIYKNFYRTIPSDKTRIDMSVRWLAKMEWNYISIVHSDDSYGHGSSQYLLGRLQDLSIHVAYIFGYCVLNVYTGNFTELHHILNTITADPVANFHGVVFIGGSRATKEVMKFAFDSPYQLGIIFSEETIYQPNFQTRSSGSDPMFLLMSPRRTDIKEFNTHWSTILQNETKLHIESGLNPLLLRMNLSSLYSVVGDEGKAALLSTGHCFDDIPNMYVSYAVKATFGLAKAIKDSVAETCSQLDKDKAGCLLKKENYRKHIWKAVATLKLDFNKEFRHPELDIPELDDTVLSFTNTGDRGDSDLHNEQCELLQYKGTKCPTTGQASFSKVSTSNTTDYYQKAQVADGKKCLSCAVNQRQETSLFTGGDLIIVVLFPIHDRKESSMGCSELRKNAGLNVALSAEFAIREFNLLGNIFKGKKFGMLLLDTCNEPLLTMERIVDMHLKNHDSGVSRDVEPRIVGYVGGLGSSVTLKAAEVTTKFNLSFVGCCSSAEQLGNRQRFPYFARMSSSLTQTVEVMLNITNDLGVRQVQVLYSEGVYGVSGKAALNRMAKAAGICIVQNTEIKEFSNLSTVLTTLRNASTVKVVLSFVRSHVVHRFAEFLNQHISQGEFLFIGSDGWGAARHTIRGFEKLEGFLVLAEEIPDDVYEKKLEAYLYGKIQTDNSSNRLLMSYIAEKHDCYFPLSFDKTRSRVCNKATHRLVSLSNGDRLDPWSPYLMHAMFALMKGVNRSLVEICNDTDSEDVVCNNYRLRPDHVTDRIRKVLFDEEKEIPYFDSNGDGHFGFVIYNLQKGRMQSHITRKVGGYSETEGYRFDLKKFKFPGVFKETDCKSAKNCQNCDDREERKQQIDFEVVKMTALGVLLVGLIAETVVIITMCRRLHSWKTYHVKRYSTIGDVRQSTVSTVSTTTPLGTPAYERKYETTAGTPTTPRSNRSHRDTPPPPPCQTYSPEVETLPKMWFVNPQTSPSQQRISNPDIQRVQNQEQSPRIYPPDQSTPTVARRFNSAPLPDVPVRAVPRANSTPYIKFGISRRQNSEPIVSTSVVPRIPERHMSFTRGTTEVVPIDSDYITPIADFPEDCNELQFYIGNDSEVFAENI